MKRYLPTACTVVCLVTGAGAAPVHEIVSSFGYPPRNPGRGPLCKTSDGWYWDTTRQGGAYGLGTVYKVKTDGSEWQTVLSFSGNGARNNGCNPASS